MSRKNTSEVQRSHSRRTDNTVCRMVALFTPRRGMLAAAGVLTVAVVMGTLLLPVPAGQAVDCVVGLGQVDFDGLSRSLATIAATLAFTAVSQ